MNLISYDADTKKWFMKHPMEQTTIMRCRYCGLGYNPSLGHKCKKKINRGINWYRTNTKAGGIDENTNT